MPKTHRLLPLLLVAAGACAAAAEGDLERAERLRADAKTLRSDADDRLRAAEPACHERFLVNRCLALAKEARLEQIRRARELEAEAGRLELAERKRVAAERGLVAPSAPPQPAAPAPTPEPHSPAPGAAAATPEPSDAAAIRRGREADVERARTEADSERRARDAEQARARDNAEAEAAARAEQARRDRERYDERIRERAAEKAREAGAPRD